MWQALFLSAALSSSPAARVDLKGFVHDEAGTPVHGATVLIASARPRKGVALACPTCYLDCWRRTTSDARGRFVLGQVDGSLVFQLGAITPAHEAAFAPNIDPLAGEAEISLRPRAPLPDRPSRIVHARVVDREGHAVASALVSLQGYRSGDSRSFMAVPIAEDGTFVAAGLPPEPLVVSFGVRGHRLAPDNPVASNGGVWLLAPFEGRREVSLRLEPTPPGAPR